MKLVHIVMALTPFGILALMTKVVAGSNAQDIMNLISFVIASYIAIAIMFVVHGLLLRLNGVDVLGYYKTVWPVLTFAFGSRSSAATIPLNVETQVEELGVPQPIANLRRLSARRLVRTVVRVFTRLCLQPWLRRRWESTR